MGLQVQIFTTKRKSDYIANNGGFVQQASVIALNAKLYSVNVLRG